MKILAIECSATPCSVALIENGNIIASDFTAERLTHSQTLMPMVVDVLKNSNNTFNNIDGFAVAAGPGSFTGVRIGISAIKGMAMPRKTPCASVSTLYAMAELYKDKDCYVCAVMDARCNQVYNAIFEIKNGVINRLCDDRALLCNELAEEIKELSQKGTNIIIMGDGADIFYPFVECIDNTILAEKDKRYQNATGVAFAAEELFNKGEVISYEKLLPIYLRLPQAERELKLKKEQEK
jgi:tRNA threonylcarbamoyladenosine biosynthesis protein TsaB